MAFSKVYSGAVIGIEPHLIEVEVNIDYQGFPGFTIVGLPSKEVDEAKERVRSAIKNSGYQFPPRRITINLAPADIPKRGSLYDLPIAIGILAASGALHKVNTEKIDISKYLILGELSLNGELNPVIGVLPLVLYVKDKLKYVILPKENAMEAAIVDDLKIKPIKTLKEIVEYFNGDRKLKSQKHLSIKAYMAQERKGVEKKTSKYIDFKYIKGQENVKRAIEIAAAGGHNLSITGPPGSGKSLISHALVSILPELTESEALESTNIYSIAAQSISRDSVIVLNKPFRAPHHSTTKVGLIGGGNPITPGEISLAHNGVLFLDEFPEYGRDLIESLRIPIEDKEITITRATGSVTFPAKFMLVVASNPCPCGNLGHPTKECTCTENRVEYYKAKMSGPIYDRIDLHVDCLPVDINHLNIGISNESSDEIKSRVQLAHDIQLERYKNEKDISLNSDLDAKRILLYCQLNNANKKFLTTAAQKFSLSARSFHKVIKIARTIADLNREKEIQIQHISEALQYRFRLIK